MILEFLKNKKQLLFLLLLTVNFLALGQNKSEKPNVVLINADDIGFGDLSVYGGKKINTPNIDKLASQGMRFTDYHSASAVCSPSRYALITGRYPARSDFWSPVFLRTPLQIDTARTTIADVMKKAGYTTGIVGKWHLGFQDQEPINWNKALKPGPLELGFDYYFGVPVLNSHPPFVYVENHKVVGLQAEKDPFVYGEKAATRYFDEKFGLEAIGGATAAHKLYKDRMVGTTLKDTAVSFIKKHKDEPFFLYFATTNIHHPFTSAPQFIGTSEAGPYGDSINELDWMVSEIMKILEEEGLAENTLLIFTSDNGGMLNRGGQTAREAGHAQNGDLLGFKFDAWEGGHRVPLIARWPGHIKEGVVNNALTSNVDLLATMAQLTGQDLNENEGPDSIGFLDVLTGAAKESKRKEILLSPVSKNHLSLRSGDWMYIPAQGGGGFSEEHPGNHTFGGPAAFPFTGEKNSDIADGKIKTDAPPAQLYNLKEDRNEHTNVYREHPDVIKKLDAELKKIMSEDK